MYYHLVIYYFRRLFIAPVFIVCQAVVKMDILNCRTHHTGNTSVQTAINYATIIKRELIEAYKMFLYVIIDQWIPSNLLINVLVAKHRPSNTTDWFILSITWCDFLSSFLFFIYVTLFVTFQYICLKIINYVFAKYITDNNMYDINRSTYIIIVLDISRELIQCLIAAINSDNFIRV